MTRESVALETDGLIFGRGFSKPEKIQLTPRKSIESSVLSFFFYCGSPEKKTPREPNTRKSINPKEEDKGRKKDLFTYLGTGHKRVATYTHKKAIGPFTMSETNVQFGWDGRYEGLSYASGRS